MPNLSLLQANVDALTEGANLLSALPAEKYTETQTPIFQSTIGAHFRHVLEHYRCFLDQLPSARFCYDKREREQRLENDFAYAKQVISDISTSLSCLDAVLLNQECSVSDQQSGDLVDSTVQREVLFLQAHTVHHYAIIALMARALGCQPQANFGVAIATREHHKALSPSTNVSGGTTSCAQ